PLFDEDGLRMTELARRARLTKQTITTMARLLERDGLIERRPDETDARATRVYLTRRGRMLKPIAQRILVELEQSMTRSLSRDDAPSHKDALRELSRID